jgi:hypothetical protein
VTGISEDRESKDSSGQFKRQSAAKQDEILNRPHLIPIFMCNIRGCVFWEIDFSDSRTTHFEETKIGTRTIFPLERDHLRLRRHAPKPKA